MKNIQRHINMVEMLLALYKKNRQESALSKVSPLQIGSIQAIVDVAKALNNLLDLMDRLITTEEED